MSRRIEVDTEELREVVEVELGRYLDYSCETAHSEFALRYVAGCILDRVCRDSTARYAKAEGGES